MEKVNKNLNSLSESTIEEYTPVLTVPNMVDAWFSDSDFSGMCSRTSLSEIVTHGDIKNINVEYNLQKMVVESKDKDVMDKIKISEIFNAELLNCSVEQRAGLEIVLCGFQSAMKMKEDQLLSGVNVFIDLYAICQQYARDVVNLLGIKDLTADNEVMFKQQEKISECADYIQDYEYANHDSVLDTRSLASLGDAKAKAEKVFVGISEGEKSNNSNQEFTQHLINMNSELQKQVRGMKRDLYVLQQQNDKQNKQVCKLERERDDLREIHQDMESSLTAISVENAKILKENSTLKVTAIELEQSFEDSCQREAFQKEKYEKLEKKFQIISSESTDNLIKKEQFHEEIKKLNKDIEEYEDRIYTLAKITKRILESESGINVKVNASEGTLDYIHLAQKKLVERTSSLEGSLLEILEEKTCIENEILKYRDQLKDMHQNKTENEILHQDIISTLENKLESMENKVKDSDSVNKKYIENLENSKHIIEKQYKTLKRVFNDHVRDNS